jgi:dipeptidyl aminopeptidase/acylaminoacyl peptidase
MNLNLCIYSKKVVASIVAGLVIALCCSLAAATALPAESLVKEVELYPYEGILPSPDGKMVAYEASDPDRVVRFDYEGQRFAKSGYPMLVGGSAISVWVTELSTGKSVQLTSADASSWSPNWSHDGKQLAFYSDRGGQAALWVWDRQTKTSKQISPVEVFFSWWRERPLWSTDGKTILTKVLPEGMQLEDVLKLAPFYADSLNKGNAKDTDPKAPTVHVYSYHPSDNPQGSKVSDISTDDLTPFFNATFLSDLVQINVASGKATRLIKRVRPIWYGYSPDQTKIAHVTMDGVVPRTQQSIFTVRIYSLATGTTKEVAKGFMDPNDLTTEVSWSPDGTRVAYHDTGKTAERAAYVVDVLTGAKIKVSGGIPESSRTFSWGPPLWDKSGTKLYLLDSDAGRLWQVAADGGGTAREVVKLPGRRYIKDMASDEAVAGYWSPDNGKTMYIRAHDNESKKDAIYAVQVDTGEATKLYEGDESMSMREMGAMTGTSRGSVLLYSSESAMRPADLWTIDVNTGQRHQLSRLNPQYDQASMGKIQIVDWLSLHGERLRGALLLPSDYHEGSRYPMVVWVYGGDMGSDKANRFAFGWGATFNPQMWASRGYAVLYPDVPLHPGTPVDDLVSAVIPGVNKVVELGVADPQRLAVMGQSFGGYNTIALLTRTSIFKAAVATSAASTDLFAAYTYFLNGAAPSEGYYEEGQGGMKGSPWDFKTRYYDNSPFFFLDRITTPLMIERGTADLISIQSANVFNGLRRLGKDVELVEYENEEHVVQQPVNVVDFWNRRIEWLQRYLKPEETLGNSYRQVAR